MLDGIFGVLEEQQKQDGEVCRPEFSPNYGVDGWPLLSDPAARQKLETFVLRNCIPERHRYRLADGSQGVVYFDARGRATSSRLTEVPDADLMRMADEKRSGFRPETGRKDHGYRGAVQEDREELKEGAGDPISIGIGKQMAAGRKQGVVDRKRYADPDDLKDRMDALGEKAAAEFSAAARSAEVLMHYGWGDPTRSNLGMDKRTMLAVKDLEKELSAGFYVLGQIMGLRGKGK